MTYKVREIEVDRATGLLTEWHEDDDGQIALRYVQDAEGLFERTQQARNQGVSWQKGVKEGFVHAFSIPAGVVMELLGIGVNVYTAPTADIVAGLKKLNRYEACDVTGKRLVKSSHK